jgi:hypothetical protein
LGVKNEGAGGQECLFGWDHLVKPEGRGRPAHQRTAEKANKVKLLLALGWSTERIANALNITAPTLRRHYFSELKIRAMARDAMEAERFAMLWQAASAGNVGAMKEVGKFVEANDRALASGEMTDHRSQHDGSLAGARAARPAKLTAASVDLGKKEARAFGAADAIASDPDLTPDKSGRLI